MLRESETLSYMDLRTGSHDICVVYEENKTTIINSKYSQTEFLIRPAKQPNASVTLKPTI